MSGDCIPEDAVIRSFGRLSFEVSFSDYSEAVLELISELKNRGWTIVPPASDIPFSKNTANGEHTENIRAVFLAKHDR